MALKTGLDLDASRFHAELSGAQRAASVAAHLIAGVLIAAVTGIASSFSRWASEIDRIGKLSSQMNLPTSEVQRLSTAASLAGASIEVVTKAMNKATIASVEAMKGTKTYADAFKTLGIDAESFSRLDASGKLRAIAEAMSGATDRATAYHAAVQLMGRGAAELLPLLGDLTSAMDEAATVTLLDHDTIKATEFFNDTLEKLATTTRNVVMNAFLNGAKASLLFAHVLTGPLGEAILKVQKLLGMKGEWNLLTKVNDQITAAMKKVESFSATSKDIKNLNLDLPDGGDEPASIDAQRQRDADRLTAKKAELALAREAEAIRQNGVEYERKLLIDKWHATQKEIEAATYGSEVRVDAELKIIKFRKRLAEIDEADAKTKQAEAEKRIEVEKEIAELKRRGEKDMAEIAKKAAKEKSTAFQDRLGGTVQDAAQGGVGASNRSKGRRVLRLEERARKRFGRGNEEGAMKAVEKADALRGKMSGLTSGEQNPMKGLMDVGEKQAEIQRKISDEIKSLRGSISG